MDPLSAVDARVLGCLIEKELTTPDYYPLTLNGLTNACNQSTNRDPVVAFGEQDVVRGLDALRERKLAFMFQGADSRVPKYGHRIVETLELSRPETSLLCVLLLRGPQTAGELRGRTQRMHEFPGIPETEAALEGLISRGLAVRMRRQAGMKEQRYAHLLCGEVATPEPVLEPETATALVRREDERIARLEAECSALRNEVAELRRQVEEFKALIG